MAASSAPESVAAGPPGYAVAGRAPPPGQDAAAPTLFQLGLWWTTALGAGFELLVHQPRLLGDAGLGPSGLVTRGVALLGVALGVAIGRRAPPARVPAWLGGAALAWAALGPLAFASVAVGLGPTLLVATALVAALTAVALSAGGRVLLPFALRLGWVGRWIDPFRALTVVAVMALGATGTAYLGPWRATAFVGALLCWLAWGWSGVETAAELPAATTRSGGARLALPWFALGAVGASLLAAEARTPLAVTARHAGETVWMERARHETWVLTSNHGAVELFENHRLRASSLVDHRYHEGLVQPALRFAPRRASVLVLGGGLGLVEREIARHADVERITVVVPEGALPAFARRLPWLAERARRALDDPRLELVVDEPLPWLDTVTRRWDVVILDLPDPGHPRTAIAYTVAAAERYARVLAPEGVLVTQAVTPFATPLASGGVRAALEAAGLHTLPYRIPVPTLGEWGFVLASRVPFQNPAPASAPAAPSPGAHPGAVHAWPAGLLFIDDAVWAEARRPAPDATPGQPQEASRLHHLRVVEDYATEVGRLR